jgi:hypothetical protein
MPAGDLDHECLCLWDRVVLAAAEIPSTHVFATGRMDTIEYTAALPYRIWEIASDLASLTSARADDAGITGPVDRDHPEVSPSLGQRRQIEESALRRVLRQIGKLEGYAVRLRNADDAIQRTEVVEHLWKPSQHHVDLLARQLPADDTLDTKGRLILEAEAIRMQAAEAIRRANEAARDLFCSGDRPESA